jgi:hypothetical protein
MRYEIGILTLCGDKSDPEFTCDEIVAEERVTWRKPRAKGLVVRVFGVTECLASDSSGAFVDGGWCLRQSWVNDVYGVMVGGGPSVEHTAVPPGLLVPLAKGRAPKGKVVVSLGDNYLAVVPDPDDPDQEGALYAIVAAVYDTDGQRSPFTVVYSAHYCEVIEALDCPAAVDTQVRYYSVR